MLYVWSRSQAYTLYILTHFSDQFVCKDSDYFGDSEACRDLVTHKEESHKNKEKIISFNVV